MFCKKFKDKFLGDFFKDYEGDFNEDYTTFKLVNSNIKSKYERLINENVIDDIDLELNRLNNCKISLESNINSYKHVVYSIVSVVVTGIVMLIFLYLNLNREIKIFFLSVIILTYIIMTVIYANKLTISNKKVLIYNVAINNLQAIKSIKEKDKCKEELEQGLTQNLGTKKINSKIIIKKIFKIK